MRKMCHNYALFIRNENTCIWFLVDKLSTIFKNIIKMWFSVNNLCRLSKLNYSPGMSKTKHMPTRDRNPTDRVSKFDQNPTTKPDQTRSDPTRPRPATCWTFRSLMDFWPIGFPNPPTKPDQNPTRPVRPDQTRPRPAIFLTFAIPDAH